MKRLSILTLTIIGTAGIVWAVSAHLKGRNPVLFVDNGLTLTGTVSYAGLGNFDTLQESGSDGESHGDVFEPGRARPSRPARIRRRSM